MRKEVLELNTAFLSSVSVVGRKESEGPLGSLFDLRDEDDRFGGKTWEEGESEMQRLAFNTLLAKSGREDRDVDALFAGDLQNQCVGSAYGLLNFDLPYFGLYGACSTCTEGLLLASMALRSGCELCGVVTSSHNCVAERQYRSPIEYGSQRAPTAQWTVTGAGAFLLGKDADGAVKLARGCPGRVIEMGVCDLANMGAAMAPAALDTLLRFFRATGKRPADYDRIVTGDLGFEGGAILEDLMRAEGIPLGDRYADCGQMIYDRVVQDVHAGGSGCGCSAAVLSAYFLPKLQSGELRRILFLSTGAMMSPDSVKQGKAIPAIAHLVELEEPTR